MPEPDFRLLRTRLLRNGIAPRYAERAVVELETHFRDLVDEGIDGGTTVREAERRAAARLGPMDDVVVGMKARRELRSWAFRHPRIAILLYPLACLAALPAYPVAAGVANAPSLARWGASLLLGGLFTAGMLLVMQLSILFG